MKEKKTYAILLGLSGLSLLLFLIALLSHRSNFTGPLLIAFFTLLAFGVRGNAFSKGFSYTIMIFAAVTISMFYPGLFIRWGQFELKASIVPLLQIIMFGMGSQMSYRDFAGANLALSVTLTAIATMLAPLITPSLMKLLAGQFVPIDFWGMMLSIINIVILPIVAGLMFNAMAYGKEKLRSKIYQGVVYLLIIAGKNLILFQTSDLATGAALTQFGKDVFWFLILPVVAAGLFKKVAGGNKAALDKVLAFLSMAGIGIIVVVITAAGRDSLLEIGFLLILACFLHNSAGYFLGYWICKLARMDEKSCRTIALEVGMQNGGLASGIALQMGRVATIGLAPAVFGPMMNITGSSLATWWRIKSENI